jgi:hypothetical protein
MELYQRAIPCQIAAENPPDGLSNKLASPLWERHLAAIAIEAGRLSHI